MHYIILACSLFFFSRESQWFIIIIVIIITIGLVGSSGMFPREQVAPSNLRSLGNNIARIVHLELCQKFGLVGKVKWFNHKPSIVVENDRVKILWDFNIQTDHVIQHRRPDIVVLYKNKRMSPY